MVREGLERIGGLEFISAAGMVVLAFIGGAYVAEFQVFPYKLFFDRPFRALEAWEERVELEAESVFATGLWHPARTSATGVSVYREGKTFGDYTLVLSAHRQAAALIDMNGEVVHWWHGEFRDIWPDPSHVSDPLSAPRVYWRRAHVFADGDILVSISGENDSPFGYGLVRLGRESTIEWRYPENVHHDFDVRDDGSILALSHEMRQTRTDPVEGIPQLDNTVLSDQVVVLDEGGTEVRRVSLLDAIASSQFREMLSSYPKFIQRAKQDTWDPLHTNYVEEVGPKFARHHEFAEPDHVMVSFRNLNAIALLDLEQREIVWASRGFWRRQHHPEPMDNGHIMVFDNGGHGGAGGGSRILEFDPDDNKVVWSYEGTERAPFQSDKRGALQVLPNGNVLVTESHGARLFEVSPDSGVVWNYWNPFRRMHNGISYAATLCGGVRYTREDLDFLQ